jgi:Helicase HerA, central domain
MLVRHRLVSGLIGLVLFTCLGAIAQPAFWEETWFYIGFGLFLSATFVEPHFARPQDAVVNASGGVIAYLTSVHDPVELLWLAFLFSSVCILLAALVATLTPDGFGLLKWASFRLSSKFGRATVIGGAALALVVLTEAAAGEDNFEYLAFGTTALLMATAVDWRALLGRVRRVPVGAHAIGALGPRVLLVVSESLDLPVGRRVEVQASSRTADGTVIGRLPHSSGLQYRIALDRDWTSVCAAFPCEIVLTGTQEQQSVIGAVGEGSTELRIAFEPATQLDIGDPVSLHVEEGTLLYQVSALRIVSLASAGDHALIPHTTARLVGWPSGERIEGRTFLPRPHEPIFRASDLQQDLPDAYYEIGHIKGTLISVGIGVGGSWKGHIAVLGMTGMGKTAVAHRICQTLGAESVVTALDTTGEYATRLGFPAFADDFQTPGYTVFEPAGDPPQEAAQFIERCMQAGRAEYLAGGPITSRVILLEEAHSFVPEWNFGLRHHSDWVAKSTRRIMQSRKFGLTFVIVSQRTAVVSKSALSQCENYIVLRTIDATSLDYLATLVGPDLREAVGALQRFEAICVGPAFNSETPVIVTLSPP